MTFPEKQGEPFSESLRLSLTGDCPLKLRVNAANGYQALKSSPFNVQVQLVALWMERIAFQGFERSNNFAWVFRL